MLDVGAQVDFVLTAVKDCHAMSTFKEALNDVGPRRATATDDESAQFRGQRFSPDGRSVRSATRGTRLGLILEKSTARVPEKVT